MSKSHVSSQYGFLFVAAALAALSGCTSVDSPEEQQQQETPALAEQPELRLHVLSGEVVCDAEDLEASDIARVEAEYQRLRQVRAARDAGSVTIPVYFHIIRQGPNAYNGDIDQSQVDAQMNVLNRAFASSAYKFQLVATDRTTNADWFRLSKGGSAEGVMMATLRKGGANTLNIYSVSNQSGMIGWSAYPWDRAARPTVDGIVISYASLPGGSEAPFNLGVTAAHMAGHWLGLLHTYETGCTGGDGVADTQPQASPAFGCPAGRYTCPGSTGDSIRNHMNSTDDSCKTGFTPGQFQRMDSFGQAYRL